tara:strand:- start:72 stop:242 length:171 start_codon:yes stop_codon:yes gene_type:complete
MKMFEDLSPKQEVEFKAWARANYKPLTPIKGVWHPIIQAECAKINNETSTLGEDEI